MWGSFHITIFKQTQIGQLLTIKITTTESRQARGGGVQPQGHPWPGQPAQRLRTGLQTGEGLARWEQAQVGTAAAPTTPKPCVPGGSERCKEGSREPQPRGERANP